MRHSDDMAAKKHKMPEIEPSTQVSIRLDPNVLADADALRAWQTERTGLPATRVDVLRAALVRGLRAMKREYEQTEAGD